MRRRIIFLAAGTAAVAVLLLAVPLIVIAGRGYERDELLELRQAAAITVAQSRGDAQLVTVPQRDGREIALAVYAPSGKRLSGRGPTIAPAVVRRALSGTDASSRSSGQLMVATTLSDGDQINGALLATTNLAAVRRRTVLAAVVIIGLGSAAVGLAATAALLVARRLTRPLQQLSAVAEDVAAGNWDARARPSGVGEMDRLGETLNDTVATLQSTIARERAFSAEVSHQLRTPLSSLRLEIEAAVADSTAHATTDRLDRALTSVDRLQHTVDDVIVLARDLSVPRSTPVRDILQDVRRRWHAQLAADARPLRLVNDTDAGDAVALSGPAATQILNILIDNAVRHGQDEVTVRVVRSNDRIAAIAVSNAGPPLTSDAVTLFAPRAASQRHGLGLPYARRLAEAEQARLSVTASDPPTFVLSVPLAAQHD